MLRSAQSAMASFAGVKFDAAPLIEAEIRFQEVLRRFPKLAEQERVPQILEQIRDTRAEKEYRIAQWYDRTKRYRAAAFYYQSVAKYWPDTHWAGLAEQAADKLPPEAEAPAEGSGEIPQAPTMPLGLPVQ
jgi:outer membrane protein assembly factor BamD (BamD/ComL family)